MEENTTQNSEATSATEAPIKPPMHRKIGVRLVIGLLSIAVLFFGYQRFADFAKDPDLGNFDSSGMILALEYDREGDTAVLFTEDGDVLTPPEPEADEEQRRRPVRDSEVSWSADGQRVFMSSNRESNSFTVHRWNPEREVVEIKRRTSRFQSAPHFDPYNDPFADEEGLILSGGYVLTYEVSTGNTSQILPPVLKDLVQNEGEGTASPMDALFEDLGESFRKARWVNDRSAMFAIMRGDATDVAILNAFPGNGELVPPREIIRAEGIDLAVTPQGTGVITVRRMFVPDEARQQFIDPNTGEFAKPFESAILLVGIDPESGGPQVQVIAAIPNLEVAFADTSISPDGSQLVTVLGGFNEEGEFRPQGLVLMAVEPNGGESGGRLIQGVVRQPSWSPDGTKIVYIRDEGEYSNVFTLSLDNGREEKISPNGRYAYPQYSPQTAEGE